MELYMAVIFACFGDQCAFLQGQELFKNRAECLTNLQVEMRNIGQKYPNANAHGVCLPISFRGA